MVLSPTPIVASVPVLVAHILVCMVLLVVDGFGLHRTKSMSVGIGDGIEAGTGHVIDVLHAGRSGMSVETVTEKGQ